MDLVASLLTLEQVIEAESRYAEFKSLHQPAQSFKQRIADALGGNADEAKVKDVEDKLRKHFKEKAADALERIKSRRAKGQEF